jgi:glycosyltransferase involved in cell wall biosynthesis
MIKNFSVTISVYKDDNPEYFQLAINSILDQLWKPNEIIVAVDGDVPYDLQRVINLYKESKTIKFIYFKENVGLGKSRHDSILLSTNEIIAVMDSDDIANLNRFKLQLDFLDKNPNIDIVGGFIEEFKSNPGDLGIIRKVPTDNNSIYRLSKWRQSVNHVTIMFRKEAYFKSGGYRGLRNTEDYDMFLRMFLAKIVFANIPEILVYVRFSGNHYARRKGIRYLTEEFKLFKKMRISGYINYSEYFINITVRIIARLLPTIILQSIYHKFLRFKKK